ncbi:RIP metalloprotease RseP [Candidatus Falkowbacteria bacterium]|nr:RIP metalloprotease RseP [Candidatus Falkowbacteria bacterium]
MLTLIVFILVLGALVFVHELGHFFVAKKLGIRSDEFGFGFPPRICGLKKVDGKRKFFWGNVNAQSEDTIYSLNWIPLGGFVKIKGEDGENKEEKDSFSGRKPWQRFVVLSAGVAMNFLFAAVILMLIFSIGAPQGIDEGDSRFIKSIKEPAVQIIAIVPKSPADEAGMKLGDVIASVNGAPIKNVDEVRAALKNKDGKEVIVQITRMDETQTLKIVPTKMDGADGAALGVGLTATGIVTYKFPYSLWIGAKTTVLLTGAIIQGLYLVIKNLIISAPIGVDVAGPVGIAVITGRAARMGLVYLLQFTALLSINLGIINFLPFPALDGGRALFLLIEKLRRKPIDQKIENLVHTVGFALLIGLIVLITGRDILGLVG